MKRGELMQRLIAEEDGERSWVVAGRFIMALLDENWTVVWGLLSIADKALFRAITPLTVRSFQKVRADLIESAAGSEEVLDMMASAFLDEQSPPRRQQLERQPHTLSSKIGPITVESPTPMVIDAEVTLHVPMRWEEQGWKVCLGPLIEGIGQPA
jgi:hypothetical protein